MQQDSLLDERHIALTIKLLLGENKLVEAEALVDTSCVMQSAQYSLLVYSGKVKYKLAKYNEAQTFFERAVAAAPEKAATYLELALVAIAKADYQNARINLSQAEQRNADQHRLLLLKLKLAEAVNDEIEIQLLLPQVIACESAANPVRIRKLLRIYLKLRQIEEAQQLINQYESSLTSDEILYMRSEIARNNGDAQFALQALEQAISQNPRNTTALASLITLYVDLGEHAKAVQLIDDAIEGDIADVNIYNLFNSLVLPKRLLAKALVWAQSVSAAATPKLQLVAARIRSLVEDDQHLAISELGKQQLKNLTVRRELIKDDLSEFILAEVAGAETMLLVFTGLANKTGMPLRTFDRYLATFNTSVMYLRDTSRLLFNRGITAIAEDFEQTIAYLQQVILQSGAKRCICLGLSAGGFAAIRYGLRLDAVKIICSGSPTNLNAEFLVNDGRARIISNRLQTLPVMERDLKYIVQQHQGRVPIVMYYAAHMPQDKLHATYLSGLPGITLAEIADTDRHDLLKKFEEEGSLYSFIDDLLNK